jgi:hypothetical protein
VANILYTAFATGLSKTINWETSVFRALLERSTSAYTPDPDHVDVADLTGLVELTAAGYSRQTLATPTVTQDDPNDRVELGCDTINFGNVAAGQTAKAIIVYQQVGGSDATPADDILVAYIDTDSGGLLPVATGGGAFQVTIMFQLAQA